MAVEDRVLTHIDQCALTVRGDINSAGEIVADLTPAALVDGAGALLAAENLADLDNATSALTNLGATAIGLALFAAEDEAAAQATIGLPPSPLVIYLPDVISANAVVVSVLAPFNCQIAGAGLWASSTIAAGSLTATLAIDGVAVTNGVMTLASGSTPSTFATCAPTANNVAVAFQSLIRVTVGGGNTAAGRGTVTICLTPFG